MGYAPLQTSAHIMSDYGALAKGSGIIAAPLRIKQIQEANLRVRARVPSAIARLNDWIAGYFT